MLPIEGVFEDIVSFTGSTRVGLVSEMDPEPATQAAPPGMVVQPRRIRIRLPRIFKPSNWGRPRRRRRPIASEAPFWSRVAEMFDFAHIWSALKVFFRHLRKAIDAQRSALELLKIAIRYQPVLYILLGLELYVLGESITITTITSI
jgi:hypothetical protein